MSIDTGLLERELCRIPEVFAARIVTDQAGQPTAARILASPRRPPTRVRRDVQSVALTSFGLDLDASAITITQLDQTILASQAPQPEEAPAASAAPEPGQDLLGQPTAAPAPPGPSAGPAGSEQASPEGARGGLAEAEAEPAAVRVGHAEGPPVQDLLGPTTEAAPAQGSPWAAGAEPGGAEPPAWPGDQAEAAEGPAEPDEEEPDGAPEAEGTVSEAGGPQPEPAQEPSGLAQLVGRLDELIAASEPQAQGGAGPEGQDQPPPEPPSPEDRVALERVTTSVSPSTVSVEVTLSRAGRQATRQFEGALSRAIGARLAASATCAALAELDVPVADLEAASVVSLGDRPAALAAVVVDAGGGPVTRTGSASVGPGGEHQAMALAVLQAAQPR
jgi:hypothetical protein